MAAAGVNWVVDQTYDEGPAALLEAVKMCYELGMDVNDVNSMGLTARHGRRQSRLRRHHRVPGLERREARRQRQRRPHAADWAEGVFLATHPARPKPSSIALIKKLMDPATRDER